MVKLGSCVEIQRETSIGRQGQIASHSFICTGVTIEDVVFVGHGVMFTNDLYPRVAIEDGEV
jgi:acetyltransferase-like isoleucine patch superfamily enzyme